MSSTSKPDIQIPVFNGANWAAWKPAILAYLLSTGCMWVSHITAPTLPAPGSKQEDINYWIAWKKANDTIVGTMKLYMLEPLRAKCDSKTTAADLVKALTDDFDAPSIAGAYVLFKELLDVMITHASHPAPALNKVETLYIQLDTAGYSLPTKVQAILLLAKLPAMMDVIAQMIAQVKDSMGKAKEPMVAEIHSAVVLSWDQHHMSGKGMAPAQANKISVVKPHKGKEPSFQQQQQNPPTSQQGSSSASGKKKKTRHSNPKKQEKQTAHLASYAEAYYSFVPDAILTPAVADPRLLAHRPASLYQGQEGPAADPRIKQAFSLAKRLEIHPSCETICSLDTTITAAATSDEMVVTPNAFGMLDLPPGSPISHSRLQTPTPDIEANTWLLLAK